MSVCSLVLDFSQQSGSDECKAFKMEVPNRSVAIGEQVELRLFGPREALDGWRLQCGQEILGPNELVDSDPTRGPKWGGQVFEQVLDFAEASEVALDWPTHRIWRVRATTDLVTVDEAGNVQVILPRGWCEEDAMTEFVRRGYSCLRHKSGLKLYGSIACMYRRLRYYRRYLWTVPAGSAGKVWFFLYDGGALHTKFSLEMPELATKMVEYKTIALRPKDKVTEAALPWVNCYLDDVYVGMTGENGVLIVRNVLSGEHAFRAEATGYLSTAQDSLSNEKIVV